MYFLQADSKELSGALSSALKALEMIESQITSFLPKVGLMMQFAFKLGNHIAEKTHCVLMQASDMDKLLSELARVNIVERNYIEESGCLLAKTNMLQVCLFSLGRTTFC